jgi:hypothetical protein
MKIHLKIEGMPHLYKIFRKKKEIDVDFTGITLRDFVNGLIKKYGAGVKKAILDQQGEIDIGLRVAINFSQFLTYGNRMDTPLNNGDTIHLMTVG